MATSESMSADPTIEQYSADELGQYRSLSSMAVVSFVLGCCSILMFATPLLVVVPLAAAASALIALRSISVSDGGLTGGRLALAGLALGAIFGVGAFARVQVRDSLLQQQADEVCQQWLTLASRGQVDDMLNMMTPDAAEKLKPEVEVVQPESFFSGMLNSALMRQVPLVTELTEMSEAGKLKIVARESVVLAKSVPAQALIDYVVSTPKSEDLSCQIGMKRYRAAAGRYKWLIDSWSLAE